MAEANKARHAFGSEANVDAALAAGAIDAYDILFLDEKKIGWIDKNGQKVIVEDKEQIVRVDELPVANGDPNVLYIYNNLGYIWDSVQSKCVPVAESTDVSELEKSVDELRTDLADKVPKKDYAPETKTESMTQPVGKDENGKLWTTVPEKVSEFENDAGYLTSHQDISGKVDKVDGKGLSTHDYDNAAKAKVDAIPEDPKYTDTVYDDTEVKQGLNQLKGDLSQLSEEIVDCIKSPASAEVGQIVKIAAVDENGKPTAWEPADMPSSVQPDWNQNDENAQDYVKNRPFYSETRNVTVENAKDEILEHFPVFAVGDTITVNVDGEEHSLVAYDDDGYVAIGDTTNSLDSGEGPLRWQIYVGEDKDTVYYSALEPHTVSYLGTFYHTIDKKYLPIGVQSHAVDGVIYIDDYNKTYTLSDGLVFDSLFGKRVLLYDEILRYGEICYINSTSDNTLYICQHSYGYRKDSDEIVLSVTVYLLSSDGKYTNKIYPIILTQRKPQ